LSELVEQQIADSVPLTADWVDGYARTYVAPVHRRTLAPGDETPSFDDATREQIHPNAMQRDALEALARVRDAGDERAVVISATGTGKTILSALDVRSIIPHPLSYLVPRGRILARTIEECRRGLGGEHSDSGKLAGATRARLAR